MPRVKLFDKEEALQKALNLFWEQGYEATSLSDLTKHLGIGKGSFYDTFGSKRELFDQAIGVYQAFGLETFDALLEANPNPVDGIRQFLNMHTTMMLSPEAPKGCFIANSTTELSNDKDIQSFLIEHNQIMKSKLVGYLKKGSFSVDLDALADTILAHVTGISVLSKIIDDTDRFQASNALFMEFFEKAVKG